MAYLFDTNVFIRLASRNDPLHQVALYALRKLRSRNEVLYFTPQVMSEFLERVHPPSGIARRTWVVFG